jgi:hypothetical protein
VVSKISFDTKYLPNGLPLLCVTSKFYKIIYKQIWFPETKLNDPHFYSTLTMGHSNPPPKKKLLCF